MTSNLSSPKINKCVRRMFRVTFRRIQYYDYIIYEMIPKVSKAKGDYRIEQTAHLIRMRGLFLYMETKTARNKAIKSKVKTYVKKVETAVEKKDVEAAKVALKEAISVINKAGSKGVYHKNTCARKISRLTKAVNEIA